MRTSVTETRMRGQHVVVHLLARQQFGQDMAHPLADLEQADGAVFGVRVWRAIQSIFSMIRRIERMLRAVPRQPRRRWR